ncbi:MAG: membrane protein insertase YidC [Acidimicrobiaceae bacterium]|nr:membrane protein insertase YidC [Acidimicrobiaceae bacterium]MYG54292.1 membrane protein insertase YidC [Acidimicrobiaceae bacterium]MYJ99821.1 membrane protein insertase YidC [Acidimicrobiaceae bacterium]
MLDLIFDLAGEVLAYCYQLWPSYGMAVAGLTLVVMIIVTPLTLKGTKSMLQMQRYQPELKAIQNRNRGDRQKMNEEMMAFQQEHGISMFGGCLPLLVQMPLFLVLFRVVQGLTSRATNFGNQFGWTSGRVASDRVLDSTAFASTDRPFLPQNLPVDSDLYLRLAGGEGETIDDRPTEMVSWGIDLSRSAQDVIGDSLVSGLPYMLLILIVLVSSLFQQKQIQGRNASAMPPQQQMLMKILPYMLPVFSFTMPAALVVYFVVSNLYRIGQQAYITRSLYRGEDSPGALLAKKREEMANAGDDEGTSSKSITPKKGVPTPKRDGSFAKTGGKQPARRNTPSRSSNKKDTGRSKKDTGRSGGKSAPAKSEEKAKGKKSDKPEPKRTGAGRTGNAPTRHHRGSGRTTEPGSPQHKKRKK